MNLSTNFNINYQEDGLTFEEQLLNYYIIKKDFNIAKEQLLIKGNETYNFINALKTNFKKLNLKINDISINKYENNISIETEDFFIYIVKDSINKKESKDNISIYAKDFNILENLINIYKDYAVEWDTEQKTSFTKFSFVNGQIIAEKNYKFLKDYKEIKKEFYPFININLFLKEFLESNENILILTGKPGVGKSKFPLLLIKEILKNPEYINKLTDPKYSFEDEKILYTGYAKNIEMLSQDIFWSKIKHENLIILDDLDFILSSRNNNREDVLKNQFLSHLLSFTDGIEKNNIKIIITTNQDYKDIDNALLRTGRLFDILRFRGLNKKEALNLWESYGLNEKEFNENISTLLKNSKDNLILQSDLASLIQNIKRNNKLIKKEDYITDSSIRITPDKSFKKMGFYVE